jgi:demethylmenaquinone methyltransferase/2-methoxy-6-polyprenyl-1,4-benzoquinol methylase
MPHPEKCLAEMARVLKVGGKCLVLEFSLPKNRALKKFYLFYLRHILPKVGNLLSTHHEAYSYLNATIETFPHGLAFEHLMKENGFTEVKSKPLSCGIATLYIGVKDE